MKRLWDFALGIGMVLVSLFFQGVFFALVVGLTCAGIFSYFEIKKEWLIWVIVVAVGLLVNWLVFRQFKRTGSSKLTMTPSAGMLFLLPRGIFRILYGRETYAEP